MQIEYRSFSDMNDSIIQNLFKFPHNADLIVGVPRSGLLPANLLAMYLNKPFTDIDSFLEGRTYKSGLRGTFIDNEHSGKIIIMDDSICTGAALEKVKDKIEKNHERLVGLTFVFAVVYATKDTKNMVDIYCDTVEMLRAFQWNIFHHGAIIPKSCFDIDGVLCPNPPVDDDGPQYVDYITKAPILYKPSIKIDNIVSCRLEKYRDITEKWLKRSGIEYNNLIMLNFNSKQERILWGKHGQFKGDFYKKSKDVLFVESSFAEALTISQISRKPVFCTETFQMINNESILSKTIPEKRIKKYKNKLKALLRKFRIK